MTQEDGSKTGSQPLVEQELAPGVCLSNGQFRITQFLASGGFGITYIAKDSLDRDVVVKECFPSVLCRREGAHVVPVSATASEQFQSIVRLFVREAKAMSKLVHPNIVGIHQIFEDNGTAYMALDFVDGCDLLDVIEEKSLEVSPDRLVLWLRKLLTAIEFVHGHDMLHRDISPDNILVDRHDNPVLIDFGAAREHATKASRALTTLRVVKDGYSPQEFYVEGSVQNRSSDLYALGATFYHLMDGQAPPNSQERIAALAEGRDDPYRPLAGRIEGYSDKFLASVDMSLKILPADRLQNARSWIELIDAAGPFVQPEPLGFDFDAIRSEVQRIAEEFEGEAPEEDAGSLCDIEQAQTEGAAEPSEAVAEVVPFTQRSRLQRLKRLVAASVVVGFVLSSSSQLMGPEPGQTTVALALVGGAASGARLPENGARADVDMPSELRR